MGEDVDVARLAGGEVAAVGAPRELDVRQHSPAEVAGTRTLAVRELHLPHAAMPAREDLAQAKRAQVVAGAVTLLDERLRAPLLVAAIADFRLAVSHDALLHLTA